MCGICGFTGVLDDNKQVLQAMMARIVHRGPDDEGSFQKEHISLGFRRLSIIDLKNGHQPMTNESGDIIIVFNGEIYNHPELREELIQKGHIFQNNSDTECLVHAYEEYKEDMLSKLRGMFAFAVWDDKEQTLFMARDPFGIKPLYYTVQNGHLIFGSEIKSILEFPGIQKDLNPDALDQYLSYQYSVLPETFFKGIYKLLPGHCLTWKNGQIESKQYWSPELKPQKTQKHAEKYAELKTVLQDSIRAHKISDVEVGSFLSSGVDSSFIFANSNVSKTFTVGFDDGNGQYSEIGMASALSESMGVKNTNKVISATEYWEVLPKINYHMDEPLADPAAVALYFVDQIAAQQVKVSLSGEGADELFGGYNIYHEPFSLRPFRLLPRGLKNKIKKKLVASPKKFRGKNFILRGCTPIEERFFGNAHLMDKEEKRAILKEHLPASAPYELTKAYYDRTKNLDDTTRMQYIDLNFWLPGDILLKADKMSMAHSLETRVPFLDREVFRVASTLSLPNKVNKKRTKHLFRQVASETLPEATFTKKKLGFPVPIRVWLKMPEYYQIVKDAFESQEAQLFFHSDQLVSMLDRHYSGTEDNSRKIWAVYMFLVWYRVFFLDWKNISK